jgi:phage FluMu protein Com
MPNYENLFFDPNIHLFSNCPNCNKLLSIKDNGETFYIAEKNCPNCSSELNDLELTQNGLQNFITTQAVSSANSITGDNLAIVIFIALVIFVLFVFPFLLPIPFILTTFFFLFSILCSITPITICILWLLKFRSWQFNDKDFVESKKKVKSTLSFWIIANVFSIILYLYKFWS